MGALTIINNTTTMETKHYVPLEIARRLRAKGYHAERYAANEMALPTYEQTLDWLCRRHGKIIFTRRELVGKTEQVKYCGVISINGDKTLSVGNEPTKEQAMNIAIIKALELI